MKTRKNKHGEKLYPCTVAEMDSNTRMTMWWTQAQLEFADYLARTGGLSIVCGIGYFYHIKPLGEAIKKAYETSGDYWRERLAKS